MLVFDLERQNRALCELFQQKLPSQSSAHYQVKQHLHNNLPRVTTISLSLSGPMGFFVWLAVFSRTHVIIIVLDLRFQVQPGPLPEYNSQLYNDSAKQVETALTEAQAKVTTKHWYYLSC